MMKKKHQDDPNEHSTDSCDENQNNVVECIHINKSIDLQKVKKSLSKTGLHNDCEECKNEPKISQDEEMGFEFDTTLWLCLRCGHQACGRNNNQHALRHFRTPHSDEHSLCVNTTVWSVWCYKCDDEVNITCKKRLLEAVEYIRKHSESFYKLQVNNNQISQMALEIIPLPEPQKSLDHSESNTPMPLPRARGLSNLGNTCFFNSVMQCLGQTPYLLELIREAEKGQHVTLPGGKMDLANNESLELMPLEEICKLFENIGKESRHTGKKVRPRIPPSTLAKWKVLTNVLADTLGELRSGRAEVYTPRLLLSRLTHRLPQFSGGDQHDSHELLRHLLDATREEDLKRYQALILEKKGFKDVNPATVSEEDGKMVRFYAQQAEALLPIDQVFKGVLVSTLQCQECGHTSHRDENFLDLSLPVTEKQLPPRRKADEIEDKPSKHQIKKEKRAERRKNKVQKFQKLQLNGEQAASCDFSLFNGKMEKSDSESDADIEDNVEDSISTNNQIMSHIQRKGTESGYNSVSNNSPDSNDRGMSPVNHIDDSGIPSPFGAMNVSPPGGSKLFMNSLPSSPSSIGTNYADMGSPLCGHNSPIEATEDDKPEDMERPQSRLSFNNNNNNNNNRSSDLKKGLEKLILNDGDSNKVKFLCNDNNPTTSFERSLVNEDERMEADDDIEEEPIMWTTTFAPRYQCKEGELSVQSCLNQFITWEFLNGSNKVACDACTERLGGPEKKVQYNNATKQLLIYNPPAVLILHLKRFQVFRFRPMKVCKFVDFPLILDIAPFVSKRSKNLPTFQDGQTQILYSLYGVVEHSGSLNGGHYVSYIKIRSELDKNSYRWNFLPRNQRKMVEEIQFPSEPEIPTGKWYYISDSYVSEVSEEKVLRVNAYLLFYERVL